MRVRLIGIAAALLVVSAVTALSQSPGKQPPPLNVSGMWEAANAGFYGQLRQSGPVISGRCFKGPRCVIRGAFTGDHVMIYGELGP